MHPGASLFSCGLILAAVCSSCNGFHAAADEEIQKVPKSSPLTRYEPTWDSIDSRPIPDWYNNAKFGIFIHWGVFSVPAFGSEWFWWYWQGEKRQNFIDFVKNNYGPGFTYADFAPQFHAAFYDPKAWAKLFEASGAQYVVLTSKHHEGFTMWPSSVSWNWNAMDVGPRRDLVGELADAVRKNTKLHFGLYHSMFEWFNPVYKQDVANNFTTKQFVTSKTLPELYEIVNRYKPEVIWSDGCPGSSDWWGSKEFIAWLYNESPVKDTVVTNDRWGDDAMCKHGGFLTCDDRYTPTHLLTRKWENCMTIDGSSWGYRRNMAITDILKIETLIATLVSSVSYGGNLLMNIGPTSDGIIVPVFQERLLQMGSWLSVNGEAIYSSMAWTSQNDTITPNVWYTCKKENGSTTVYAIVLTDLAKDFIVLGAAQATEESKITILGYNDDVDWEVLSTGDLMVSIPRKQDLPTVAVWGFTLRMKHLKNADVSNYQRPLEGERPPLPTKGNVERPWRKVVAAMV
ncbi:plasma alpha-L-fucosidase-like [Paramacrobiotus metropolitanus]|uniref:plasma alpha-L-fucosidase-like n=1 Tax=Paramacrobiotus metropolitanus TaxID=2943436 RepID=UPI002445C70B|nr:plasma alpha-L-fucosidase-like [Paramacrobiotus metropolitanus]